MSLFAEVLVRWQDHEYEEDAQAWYVRVVLILELVGKVGFVSVLAFYFVPDFQPPQGPCTDYASEVSGLHWLLVAADARLLGTHSLVCTKYSLPRRARELPRCNRPRSCQWHLLKCRPRYIGQIRACSLALAANGAENALGWDRPIPGPPGHHPLRAEVGSARFEPTPARFPASHVSRLTVLCYPLRAIGIDLGRR